MRSSTDYFLQAVDTVSANKERYATAEALARQQRISRPHWYQMFNGTGIGETFSQS